MRDASGVGGRTVREGQEVWNQRCRKNGGVQKRDSRGRVTRRNPRRLGREAKLPQNRSGGSGHTEELALARPVLLLMSGPIRNRRERGRLRTPGAPGAPGLRTTCVRTVAPVTCLATRVARVVRVPRMILVVACVPAIWRCGMTGIAFTGGPMPHRSMGSAPHQVMYAHLRTQSIPGSGQEQETPGDQCRNAQVGALAEHGVIQVVA